jgi:hypothetical protein
MGKTYSVLCRRRYGEYQEAYRFGGNLTRVSHVKTGAFALTVATQLNYQPVGLVLLTGCAVFAGEIFGDLTTRIIFDDIGHWPNYRV